MHCLITEKLTINCLKNQVIYSKPLKVQSFKLNSSKFMIVSTQITNTEIFAFIVVLVFKLLRLNVLFINIKRQKKQLKSGLLLKKIANLTGKGLQKNK